MPFREFLGDNWAILLTPLLGLVAIYALLPKPRQIPVLLGAGAAGAALLVAGFAIVGTGQLSSPELVIETVLFYTFAATALLAGGLLVTQQNPARAALSFALVVLATTGLFLLQAAPFLMAATIIVYAGAIIVTFLFVLMLAQQRSRDNADARSREPFLASMTGFLLLFALLYILKLNYKPNLDYWVNQSKARLDEVRQLLDDPVPPVADRRRALIRDLSTFCNNYERWLRNEYTDVGKLNEKQEGRLVRNPAPPGTEALERVLTNLKADLPTNKDLMANVDLKNLEKVLDQLYKEGKNARNNPALGAFLPPANAPLSELSGPHPGRQDETRPKGEQLRRDESGRPHLPAENTVYLGRSLFTDFLLPVELAGTLLLVATIGAIAIAHRKDIEEKGIAVSPNGPVPRRNA